MAAWRRGPAHRRLSGMLALTPPADATRRARVIRFIAGRPSGTTRRPASRARSSTGRGAFHVALQSAFYYRGEFAAVERLAWAARARGPVTATLAEIYRVAVLRNRGDLSEARALLEAAEARIRASRFIEFWQQVEAEAAVRRGDRERGLRLIRAARVTSRHHGYRLADRAVFAVIEGRMLTRLGRLPEAVEALGGARAWCAARGLHLFREWADTWYAIAHLGLGGDPDEAHALLDAAAAGMMRAGRRLELPAALVALAEASWRRGDEAGHDAAADAAHAAAVSMGTLGPLLTALETLPEVLARRIDAAPADDPVGGALSGAEWSAPGRASLEDARLVVRTLGRARGRARGAAAAGRVAEGGGAGGGGRPGRPGGGAASGGRGRAVRGEHRQRNYLRQLVHRLRRALPAGVTLSRGTGGCRGGPPMRWWRRTGRWRPCWRGPGGRWATPARRRSRRRWPWRSTGRTCRAPRARPRASGAACWPPGWRRRAATTPPRCSRRAAAPGGGRRARGRGRGALPRGRMAPADAGRVGERGPGLGRAGLPGVHGGARRAGAEPSSETVTTAGPAAGRALVRCVNAPLLGRPHAGRRAGPARGESAMAGPPDVSRRTASASRCRPATRRSTSRPTTTAASR